MHLFVTILHIMLSLSLIAIILLQPGKDGASVFGGGGGGNQMYGPRGQANLLGRATTVVAALFMVTSITLAVLSGERSASDTDLEKAMEELEAEEANVPVLPSIAPPPASPLGGGFGLPELGAATDQPAGDAAASGDATAADPAGNLVPPATESVPAEGDAAAPPSDEAPSPGAGE